MYVSIVTLKCKFLGEKVNFFSVGQILNIFVVGNQDITDRGTGIFTYVVLFMSSTYSVD